MHVRQKGIVLPVSNIRAQMRQGAGKISEASASHIPRKFARKELAAWPKVRQAYADHEHKGSKTWHDSCQGLSSASFSRRSLVLASTNPQAEARATLKPNAILFGICSETRT